MRSALGSASSSLFSPRVSTGDFGASNGVAGFGPASPACIGVKSFVCAWGEKDAQEWRQSDESARALLTVRLGARVNLTTKLVTETEIRSWTVEVNRLQPSRATGPPRAPTSSLESRGQLRVVLFKNGVFEKAKSTTVLLPLGNMASYVETLLGEATARLRLPSAARALFTGAGRLVAVLDTKQPDLAPDEEGQLPPLWVSCGEPWIDASKESELKAVKHEYHQLKKQLRSLCDRLSVNVAGQMEAPVSEEDSVLYEQLQAGRTQLASLQKTIDALVGRATLGDDSRLAQGPRAVRVRVRRNGTWTGAWQLCWGSTLQELLTSCSQRLGFAARKLYTSGGLPVVDTSELRMDQHVYVSAGEGFVETKELRLRIKTRSEFAKALRAQQQGGEGDASHVRAPAHVKHKRGCAAAGESEGGGEQCECGLEIR